MSLVLKLKLQEVLKVTCEDGIYIKIN